MHRKQITLADLAKQLQISTATVSRALKDYPDISQETKQRVLALAKELNYRPNTMAAGLRKRESKVIGVIIPSIVNHFFSSVIKGIMEVAYQADYRVMLCQSDESYEKETADARALFNSRVDGLLVSLAHETRHFDHFREFTDSGTPLVFFDKVPPREIFPEISRVVVDDYQGAYAAVSHLIGQGHRQIAHFSGPMQASTSSRRYQGYLQALKDHGLHRDEQLVFACEDITYDEGQAFAQQLIEQNPACTAIFCITDMVAMGAMQGAKLKGRQIPTDMAIAGFSDWKMSSIVQPPLTSVAQPSLEMGRISTQLLLQEIRSLKDDKPVHHETITLETSLKIRASSSLGVPT
ncbi:MAG: LacI family DNA-binding transcriptional regulator [Bacteroidota bacterium]